MFGMEYWANVQFFYRHEGAKTQSATYTVFSNLRNTLRIWKLEVPCWKLEVQRVHYSRMSPSRLSPSHKNVYATVDCRKVDCRKVAKSKVAKSQNRKSRLTFAEMERILGRYEGEKNGPLVLVFGAMHGNEPAGVAAIQEVFNMLDREPTTNPGFVFSGQLVGLVGNLAAFGQNQRYIAQDLNRMWHTDFVAGILAGNITKTMHEHWELEALAKAIRAEIGRYQPAKVILLDLHTTSASGGIFTIPLESDPESVLLSASLHAPVVLGLLDGLEGTFMHYAHHPASLLRAPNRSVHALAFEAGQHSDSLSVNRAISATIGLLRGVSSVRNRDVDNHHDAILQEYAINLPKMSRITHVHHIAPDEAFVMRPGYVNFQPIEQAEYIADNRFGPIHAPSQGHILMPLYQPQGVDGYFLVEAV